MANSERKILVTTALPYANGTIHLGHLVEHIQADIWVRSLKLKGHDVLFVCGDDAHGTPIMISAQKKGITPEELIADVHKDHKQDFDNFHIDFDNYYTTHSEENKILSEKIYNKLHERGDIESRTIMQAYDSEKNMFLPDRFVKGECPRCGAADQYGDNCESCGATYSPSELKNPKSTLSGTTPTEKESLHYFFKLENYHDMLHQWIQDDHLQKPVTKKLLEWFESGLKQWDISRDEPYFGFEIPNAPGKYFYVWLDAPIGYMASLQNFCSKNTSINFDDYWKKDSEAELYHFIGKDIIYFHTLFWPAMLEGAEYRKPTKVFAHGFLTVNGLKMSKSRGTFIEAKQYTKHLDPDYLRYYYAAKLNNSIDDIDLNLEDFVQRVNSDLVGKVINIASRCAGFITKKFDGKLSTQLSEPELFKKVASAADEIGRLLEDREYNFAMRETMALADIANQYIAEKEPWVLAKDDNKLQEVQDICTMGLNLFKILMVYLKPVTPKLVERAENFLNYGDLKWHDASTPLLDHTINKFKPLMQRIDPEIISKLSNV